jgi:hypothetical protein
MTKPGRPPRDQEELLADQTIAKTIWALQKWGFSLRSRILPEVAKKVPQILKRTNSNGAPLSAEYLEHLYEAWLETAPSGWIGADAQAIPLAGLRRPSTFQTDYRKECAPHGKTLSELVENLLQNAGATTFAVPRWLGDPVYTDKVSQEIESHRPFKKNGEVN